MATDALYQLYVEHYRQLEERFCNVRDVYGVETLAEAGIPMMRRNRFEQHVKSISTDRAAGWLARMLQGQQHRWTEIEQGLRLLRDDVEQLRRETGGAIRAAG